MLRTALTIPLYQLFGYGGVAQFRISVLCRDFYSWIILIMEENPEHSIKVGYWDHEGVQLEILRKEATELHRTLGYHINVSKTNKEATNMYMIKAKQFNTAVLRSTLSS